MSCLDFDRSLKPTAFSMCQLTLSLKCRCLRVVKSVLHSIIRDVGAMSRSCSSCSSSVTAV